MAALLSLLLPLVTAGCGASHDLGAWREVNERPRLAAERGDVETDLARVEELRRSLRLAEARTLALALVAEHRDDPRILFLASRAESDQVALAYEHEKDFRALAALSALDYARALGPAAASRADWLAQWAWAMGTSTHLQPMLSRARHARETEALVSQALAADPRQPRALATGALLNLRLQTLPWIANVMSIGEPASSLVRAEELARSAIEVEPSLENRLILAKVLRARGESEQAVVLVRDALAQADAYPRDAEMRPDARRLLESLEAKP